MRVEIKIPAMGESVIEGTVGNIIKGAGAQVKVGEEVIEIETDKVNQVLYAPADGQIQWSVKTADVVKIGDVIGFVDTEGKNETAPPQKEKALPQALAPAPQPPKTEGVRKNVDQAIEEMKIEKKEPEPLAKKRLMGKESRQKMTKLRRVIAERLVEVKNKTALLTTFNEVDMSAVMQVREENQKNFQEKHGIKLGFMSFFIKASAHALQEFPDINARIENEDIVYHHYYNIGVAVSTEKGLMVPVIRDADLLSYAEIEKQLKEFSEKARSGRVSVDEMQGGTFTITNGGVFGSLLSTPILNPPQSGILGMHNIVKRAVVVNDEIVIRPMMYLALSYDHRIVDGKESIQFLVNIKKNLEDPARLLLDL